jgi:hypothetical protein
MDSLTRIPTWLRWILLLPLSMLAHVISYPIMFLVSTYGLNQYTVGIYFIIANFLTQVMAGFGSAVVFIWVGAKVAPTQKFVVSIVLAVIYFIYICGIIYYKYLYSERFVYTWFQLSIVAISGILACIGTVYQFYDLEKTTD